MKTDSRLVNTREQAEAQISTIHDQIGRVIIGQSKLINQLLIALLSKIPYSFKGKGREKSGCGHVLLEGVPGTDTGSKALRLARTL